MKKFLTIKEISEDLKVSVSTVRRWVMEGKLKTYKLGKVIRISEEDLMEFIENNKTNQ
ncbi:MAG: helix-turn-helix domain-containing protein [Atribacterota bacterium]|jgi:excisionase family DNA binding protein|nr:helix-turn-helix domain-containing protein [Atribacterota bacterium]HHT09990.1 helix-turn-helix domain-containing protein [Candidatus Atribacteria bacterium]